MRSDSDLFDYNAQYVFITTPQNQVCYARGTNILCDSGYIPIEELEPGMLVQTYLHGYLPVDQVTNRTFINDPTNWKNCMYRMPKQVDMLDDLVVTGGHSILRESIPEESSKQFPEWFSENNIKYNKIDDLYLLLAAFSKDFIPITSSEEFEIYHFSLKGETESRHYGVWANGVLSESTINSELLKLK